jgi:hypothetical protein
MWVALLIGVLIGHFGSQWLTYKNVMFKVVNHAIISKVDHKGKRLLNACCCRRQQHHHQVSNRQFDIGMMMNVLKSLSSIATPQQMMTLSGMAQGVMGNSTKHPSTRQRTDSRVNHIRQHQPTHNQSSHQQHPPSNQDPSSSNTHRQRIPLRKPSSYLLATD